jgi:hypothetical protein
MSKEAESYLKFATSVTRQTRSKPRVVTSDAQAPMVLRGAEKEIAETDAQLRRYERARKQEQEGLLDGPHAEGARALVTLLKALSPDQAPALIQLLEDFNWFRNATDHDRLIVLGMIDDAIIRMRIRAGLPPIDDSIGEDPTMFELCRSELTGV